MSNRLDWQDIVYITSAILGFLLLYGIAGSIFLPEIPRLPDHQLKLYFLFAIFLGLGGLYAYQTAPRRYKNL